jgi:hypothetical protein
MAMQVYPGNFNGVRYRGYWYGGLGKVDEYAPSVSDLKPGVANVLADGGMLDSSANGKWASAPGSMVYQDAMKKRDGKAPGPDVMVRRIEVK